MATITHNFSGTGRPAAQIIWNDGVDPPPSTDWVLNAGGVDREFIIPEYGAAWAGNQPYGWSAAVTSYDPTTLAIGATVTIPDIDVYWNGFKPDTPAPGGGFFGEGWYGHGSYLLLAELQPWSPDPRQPTYHATCVRAGSRGQPTIFSFALIIDFSTERTFEVWFDEANLTYAGTAADNGLPATFEWDLGDGTPPFSAASLVHVRHTYSDWHEHIIRLTVTDTFGRQSIAWQRLRFVQHPPVAVIAANPTNFPFDFEWHFDGSQSHDPDGTIVSYEWDFGDGTTGHPSTGTGSVINHTYSDDGTYTVTLTVTDNDGLTGTATFTAPVSELGQIGAMLGPDNAVYVATNIFVPGFSDDAKAVSLRRYDPVGGTTNLGLLPDASLFPSLMQDRSGRFFILAQRTGPRDWYLYDSADGGRNFTALGVAWDNHYKRVRCVLRGDGTFASVATRLDGTANVLWLATSADGLTWSAPLQLGTVPHPCAPTLLEYPDGRLQIHAVCGPLFESIDSGATWTQIAASPWPAGAYLADFILLRRGQLASLGQVPGPDGDLRRVFHVAFSDDGVTWSGLAGDPTVATSYDGTALLERGDGRLYFVDPNGPHSRSDDSGRTWTGAEE
jgi:PKD repeat protein